MLFVAKAVDRVFDCGVQQLDDQQWSLGELDVGRQSYVELTRGLGQIGGLCVDPVSSDCYVSLSDRGEVLRVRPPALSMDPEAAYTAFRGKLPTPDALLEKEGLA